MPENIKYRLKILMQKYLYRTCTIEERNELVRLISKTSGPEKVDELWKEVWAENGSSIELEELKWGNLQELSAQESGSKLRVVWKQLWKWSAAAAAILLCVYFISDWMMSGDNWLVYETGYGETLQIVLEDGTRVDLNADSRLSWNRDWGKSGVREVTLEGEAFFDVSHVDISANHDQESKKQANRMPFEVTTEDVTIHVLGTAFNTLQRRGKTEVFLERGLVELSLHRNEKIHKSQSGRKKKKDNGSNPENHSIQITPQEKDNVIRMAPGDFVSFSSQEDALVQKTVEVSEDVPDWKEGVLSYRDEQFSDMLQNLEDLYGKTFEVKDHELIKKRVRFSVPYKDWSTVKEMMELMLGVKLTETGENIIQIKKRIGNQPVK